MHVYGSVCCWHVQVKDMKERLEEAESMGVRRMKAQVQAMEGRVSSLEEQLDAATRYRPTGREDAQRIIICTVFSMYIIFTKCIT